MTRPLLSMVSQSSDSIRHLLHGRLQLVGFLTIHCRFVGPQQVSNLLSHSLDELSLLPLMTLNVESDLRVVAAGGGAQMQGVFRREVPCSSPPRHSRPHVLHLTLPQSERRVIELHQLYAHVRQCTHIDRRRTPTAKSLVAPCRGSSGRLLVREVSGDQRQPMRSTAHDEAVQVVLDVGKRVAAEEDERIEGVEVLEVEFIDDGV